MDHPRSAFGAAPSRGRTQRTGEAGSAGAWHGHALCVSRCTQPMLLKATP